MLIPAGGASEFQKRVHFIRDDPCLHVFEPLMKRCLDKRPSARGTFEDVMEDIQPHLHKYSKTKNTESMEEKRVRIYIDYICTCALIFECMKILLL